ncbi:hypothetical protein CXF85_19310 [Colwellia sp. 75C3]|uniref:hypothetical protein n=1 Tax=Colwellia sp. 75C3 TaxID=888425 RepID=UPI000C3450A4|nr:hypothetical protein [Colwellia sp. 75C3]PKG81601.1 hypothetical protein CXF85_19310 [Colwellia sp. 75C3]
MSTNKSGENGNNLLAKQAIEIESTAAPFYQYFTVYLIAIFLVVVVALSSALLIFSQQSTSSQALITDHLVPLQTQFIQQTYLINTNKLIDGILKNGNASELITLQHTLSLQSKKLSLLKSEHKNIYQQWFTTNNLATNLITRIESSQTRNDLLKNRALIQLDTLLDAIKIQLNNSQRSPSQVELLSKVERKTTNIVVMLKRLSLQTPLTTFEQLDDQINSMFSADYAKQLAHLQNESLAIADIVRDFIRFEDLILKRGLLVKWQAHLTLMDDYQQQLVVQQQQLHSILDSTSGSNQAENPLINDNIATNERALSVIQLPLWIFIIFALALSFVTGLLWLIRARLKSASQSATRFIDRVLDGEQVPLLAKNKASFLHLEQADFYSHESEQIANKIQELKSSSYSELEYLALKDDNENIEKQIVKGNSNQEKLKLEVELLEFNAMEKYKSQLLLEQERCKELHLAAIKQLVLLGRSAVTTANICDENGANTEDNYLYHAHLQGRNLVRKLRQASCYRYLQSNDAVLTLSDVNLVSQIQAILLNLRNRLFTCKNTVLVSIDEKILTEVNLDTELFSEMFGVYIRLLLSQQTGGQLALNLHLVDKNDGQQKICFSGHVGGKEKIVQLPQALQGFNDESAEKSELGDYFITLLQYQHGGDVSAKLTDKGYDFSFTLPLAVTRNQQEKSYPMQSFPGYLTEIENVCVKLAAKYLAMPIEVLLAVKSPEQYQRLQQLLQGMGLQVTFVNCERMLDKNWKSGRFSVLITEIDCQPFCSFMIDEGDKPSDKKGVVRAVFSLVGLTAITTKSNAYSDWIVEELNAQGAVSELIIAMQPWLKEQNSVSVPSEKVVKSNASKESIHGEALAVYSPGSFNFERYIKHQGSAELAIFMLEEYTTENICLVEKLSHAFGSDDTTKANAAIQALLINSKILAADDLIQLCQYWQTLLATQGLNNSEKVQISLLSKTKKAVQEINQHADSIA